MDTGVADWLPIVITREVNSMVTKVADWLRKWPEVLHLVCYVSCFVGLLCFALSSSSNELFGEWIRRKIQIYIVVSILFLVFVVWLGVTSSNRPISTHWENITSIVVLLASCAHTYIWEKKVDVEPDAFIFASYAAFSIMSLSLSTLSHFGFEVELFYFFTCILTIELMKIKWWLLFVGGLLMYFLVNLRSILDDELKKGSRRGSGRGSGALQREDIETGHLQNEDGTPLLAVGAHRNEEGSNGSQEDLLQGDDVRSTSHAPLTRRSRRESPRRSVALQEQGGTEMGPTPPQNEDEERLLQEGNGDNNVNNLHSPGTNPSGSQNEERSNGEVLARFLRCIEECKNYNDIVAKRVFRANNHVDENFVVDNLRKLEELRESAQLMIKAGLEKRCLEEYASWRREFLRLFPLPPDLEMKDMEDMEVNNDKIEDWQKTLKIAVRILFPNEMTLCKRVFEINELSEFAFVEVCKERAIPLIVTSFALASWSHSIPNTLQQLLQELDTMFRLFPGQSSLLIADQVHQVGKILANFASLKDAHFKDTVADGIHSITRQMMHYIGEVMKKGKKISPSALVKTLIKLLESNLEATSKSYKTPLRYVFIMINRTFIAGQIERLGLEPIIGRDWIQGNQDKIKENLQLYLKSSWDKILNLLDVRCYNSMPEQDVFTLMEDNLSSFIQHFDGICNDKSMWFVFDDKLRDRIIKSIKNELIPKYKHFVESYQDLYPKYTIIRPQLREVEDRVNYLFRERADESYDAGRKDKKNN